MLAKAFQSLAKRPIILTPERAFRQTFVNPYKQDPTPMSETERDS